MLAKTPPMGWNSWNTFGHHIDEQVIQETADAFISEGVKDAGYEYLVIDDLWEADERVDGKLTWDKEKFPMGIPALSEYVHSKGLKFGIYSCAGRYTCAGKPASYGHEEVDAQTFADWGVDFLKYDYCYVPPGLDDPMLYKRMGQALRATGRPIVYSLCEWGMNKPWEWGALAGAHMWRTTGDIADKWDSVTRIGFQQQAELHASAGPGHWNDPDMLIVGMYDKGHVARGGCTDAEYRSHFSLWVLLASPLMIGCDIRSMNQVTKDILLNPEILAVNQDTLGCQGARIGTVSDPKTVEQIWMKPCADGSIAVGMFNLREKGPLRMTVAWESIGLHDRRPCKVRDLWNKEDLGVFTGDFSTRVPSHDVVCIKISPVV